MHHATDSVQSHRTYRKTFLLSKDVLQGKSIARQGKVTRTRLFSLHIYHFFLGKSMWDALFNKEIPLPSHFWVYHANTTYLKSTEGPKLLSSFHYCYYDNYSQMKLLGKSGGNIIMSIAKAAVPMFHTWWQTLLQASLFFFFLKPQSFSSSLLMAAERVG